MNQEINEKAQYCLNCKLKPCSMKGCPLNNDIPGFINKIKKQKIEEAYAILLNTTVLPAICGRICPHQKQCEGSCVRGIKATPVNIGELEAYVGDYAINNSIKIKSEIDTKLINKKVAIVGGGPSGLACAAFLAKKGVKVTIFERYDFLGGLLIYGIPDFRLSKDIVKHTIQNILDLGVEVQYNQILGKNLELEGLTQNYDKVFLSFGANVSSKMEIEGENLDGVYGANELLEFNLHPNYHGKKVIINGGGNVAMDAARTVKRLGAEKVTIVYRRSREEMPSEEKEIEAAINEGIEILFQHNIVKIEGDKKVEKVELIKTQLIQKNGEARLFPVNIEKSNYEIEADYVIRAIGAKTDKFVKKLNLELTPKEYIKIDDNYKTSNPKVYAGGDIIGKNKTVAWACKDGREVAKKIIKEFLQKA